MWLSHLTLKEGQQQTSVQALLPQIMFLFFIATNCLFACFGGRGRGRDFNVKEIKQVFYNSSAHFICLNLL